MNHTATLSTFAPAVKITCVSRYSRRKLAVNQVWERTAPLKKGGRAPDVKRVIVGLTNNAITFIKTDANGVTATYQTAITTFLLWCLYNDAALRAEAIEPAPVAVVEPTPVAVPVPVATLVTIVPAAKLYNISGVMVQAGSEVQAVMLYAARHLTVTPLEVLSA